MLEQNQECSTVKTAIKACLLRNMICIWDTVVVILNVVPSAISPLILTTSNNIKKNFISSKNASIVKHQLMPMKSKNTTKSAKLNQLLAMYASYLSLCKNSRATEFNANLEHRNAQHATKLSKTKTS